MKSPKKFPELASAKTRMITMCTLKAVRWITVYGSERKRRHRASPEGSAKRSRARARTPVLVISGCLIVFQGHSKIPLMKLTIARTVCLCQNAIARFHARHRPVCGGISSISPDRTFLPRARSTCQKHHLRQEILHCTCSQLAQSNEGSPRGAPATLVQEAPSA